MLFSITIYWAVLRFQIPIQYEVNKARNAVTIHYGLLQQQNFHINKLISCGKVHCTTLWLVVRIMGLDILSNNRFWEGDIYDLILTLNVMACHIWLSQSLVSLLATDLLLVIWCTITQALKDKLQTFFIVWLN